MAFTESDYQAWLAKGLVREPGRQSNKSRLAAWLAQPRTPSLPLSDPEPGEVVFPFSLVNKANTYIVAFHARIQHEIERIKKQYPEGWRWRIRPSAEAEAAEQALAIDLSQRISRRFQAGQPVEVWLRVIGRKFDADAIKLILDALEQARIVANDNQVKALHIRVEDGPASLGLRIELIEGWE